MATKDGTEIRLSHDLSEGELKATQKRKEKVLMCLKSLGVRCGQNNIPNIAVLGSGGGLRAMIALLGTLVELKKENFLDAVTYLCGVSGSTWSMSILYEDWKWSENLMSLEKKLREKLSTFSWHTRKAKNILEESSKDTLYSLTDVWASCVVYPIVHQFNENRLDDHKEASETGINPYPIYAAVDKEKLNQKGENFPGTWFEFTPHETGYPALGAFVCTKYFGSQFERGKLKKTEKRKTICYLQALWGSALGNKEMTLKTIKDAIGRIFTVWKENFSHVSVKMGMKFLRRIRKFLFTPHYISAPPPVALFHGNFFQDEHKGHLDPESHSDSFMACQAALLLLDLLLCALSGSDPKEVFEKLLNILSGDKKKSAFYQLCVELCDTWAMKTREERADSCAELGEEMEKEFGVCIEEEEDTPEGQLPPTPESFLGSWPDVIRTVLKTLRCMKAWRWGTIHNFLYNCSIFPTSYENKIISLVDAGLAINSAYPLVLRAERQIDLILSFDFSSGDPFESLKAVDDICQAEPHSAVEQGNDTLTSKAPAAIAEAENSQKQERNRHATSLKADRKDESGELELKRNLLDFRNVIAISYHTKTVKKTAGYCRENGIPFPKIEDQEMDENNPSDCYIFQGDKSCPTVMHFPLFNKINCSGEIDKYRQTFCTLQIFFSEEDIKDLLEKARLNVSNNSGRILQEINRLVSSSHTKEF